MTKEISIKNSNTSKTSRPKPSLNLLLDANIRLLAGESIKVVSKDVGLSEHVLKDRLRRINEFKSSTIPALSMDQQIISESLSEHLKPIKESLSLNSLEIVRRADELTLQKLNETPLEDLKLKDLVTTADSHESRLARITGLEDHPDQGANSSKERVNRISVFVENMFAGHSEKLKSNNNFENKNNKENPVIIVENASENK